ncbi:MAG TPA: TlpA disulfide reductase family protein [Flavobacterium sp.]|nr:TlpA disulfide reductase family protein [Flavobacterium sp.]
MKKSVVLLFLVCCNIAFSQIGKVYLKDSKFKIGKENTYLYEPPKGLTIPNEAKVKIVYHNKFDYANVAALLTKKSNVYEFSLKVPDSIRTLIVGVFDGKNIVDNNQNKGYDVYLKTGTPTEIGKCIVNKIEFIGYANYFLNLKLNAKPEDVLVEYNSLYAKYPMMKEDISYENYLYTKGRINMEESKQDILMYAQKCEKKNTEEYWMAASRLYGQLKMEDKVKQLENQMTAKYPNGEFEKNKFTRDFAQHPDKTEQYILERLELYTTRFNDNSEKSKVPFYYSILKIYLTNKDFQKLDKYENLLVDKTLIASLYNDFAWNLSGEDLITPSKDIEYAEKISKRSLNIITNMQKESYFPEDLQGNFNMYADTYALILYKLSRFEEAFQYQDKINELGGLDTGGKERYAGMMEKVKGLEFTKKYIETELANGLDSRVLLAQLEEIYKKSNLSLAEFNKIKEKAVGAANAKNNAALIEKYGSTQAIDFSLKNLEGKEVKLSDYKGKVVVLDFWATWCGPCKASFPSMQELVTKYKGKDVEFLFVNTWERGKENSDTVKKVETFINDKKYSFNVVFDFDDTITAKYKVGGIPTKILIDKNGTILSDNASEQNLMNLIDEQLSL